MLTIRPSAAQLAQPIPQLDPEVEEIRILKNQMRDAANSVDSFAKRLQKLTSDTAFPLEERKKLEREYRVLKRETNSISESARKEFWHKATSYWQNNTAKKRSRLVHTLYPLSNRHRSTFKTILRKKQNPQKSDHKPHSLPTILERPNQSTNTFIAEIQKCFREKNRTEKHWIQSVEKTKFITKLLSLTSGPAPSSRLKNLSMERENARLNFLFAKAKFWRKVVAYWEDDSLGDPDTLIEALFPTDSPERSDFMIELQDRTTDRSNNP